MFDVLAVVAIQIIIFLDVVLLSIAGKYQLFGETYSIFISKERGRVYVYQKLGQKSTRMYGVMSHWQKNILFAALQPNSGPGHFSV